MEIVRRSRGSSTGLRTEGEREALVSLAALAIARCRGEEPCVEERGSPSSAGNISGECVDVPSIRNSSPIARALSTVNRAGVGSPSADRKSQRVGA